VLQHIKAMIFFRDSNHAIEAFISLACVSVSSPSIRICSYLLSLEDDPNLLKILNLQFYRGD